MKVLRIQKLWELGKEGERFHGGGKLYINHFFISINIFIPTFLIFSVLALETQMKTQSQKDQNTP